MFNQLKGKALGVISSIRSQCSIGKGLNQTRCMDVMIEADKDINGDVQELESPIIRAIKDENAPMVKKLAEDGADLSGCLLAAVELYNAMDIIETLIKHQTPDIDQALRQVVEKSADCHGPSSQWTLKRLIEAGAVLNEYSLDVIPDHDMTMILLDGGIDLDLHGPKMLEKAMRLIVEYAHTPLLETSKKVHKGFIFVRDLLEKGVTLQGGELATVCGLPEITVDTIDVVRLLIQHGADPNEANKNGETCLALAARPHFWQQLDWSHWPYHALVKILLEEGARPTTEAIECAKRNENKKILDLIQVQYEYQLLQGHLSESGFSISTQEQARRPRL
ncbi:MAG: hypothetical protein KGI42_14550 [Xanthomonadaceae bacterium]|nr:hypothetical protein [Xanthomonadaceae bacterium]